MYQTATLLHKSALRRVALVVASAMLLVGLYVGLASAERVMTQSTVSVTTTVDGIAENGMSFFTYDGGPFTVIDLDGAKAISLSEREGSSSRYLYLNMNDTYVFGGPFDAEITFTYMAPKTGKFRLLYDSLTTGDRYTDSGYVDVKPEDVNKWVSHTFKLENITFSNRAASGTADMRLHTTPNLPFYVRSVEIKLTER